MTGAKLRYDPIPEPDPPAPGVTIGHVVHWSGEPGPARIARAHMLVDEDGVSVIEISDEWTDTTVVDDS